MLISFFKSHYNLIDISQMDLLIKSRICGIVPTILISSLKAESIDMILTINNRLDGVAKTVSLFKRKSCCINTSRMDIIIKKIEPAMLLVN